MRSSLLIASLLFALASWSQTTNISPYSIYGIGDAESRGLAQHMGMGDTKYSQFNTANVNSANPATYATLFQPIFDVNFATRQLDLRSANGNQRNGEGYFKHFGLGLPIGKRFGVAFGVQPFSRYGYTISSSGQNDALGDLNYVYEGDGGLNQFYMGTGAKLFRDSAQVLYFGVNFSYYFGRINSSKETQLIESSGAFPVAIEQSLLAWGSSFDFGLFYRRKLTANNFLNVGASYVLGGNAASINAKTRDFAGTFTDFNTQRIFKDTVLSQTAYGDLLLPSTLGLGVNLELNRTFNILLEYENQAWSQLSVNGNNYQLSDRNQVAFGMQYVPNYKAISNLLKVMRYRAGFRYANTRLNVQGTAIDEFGISLGIGLPLIKSLSNTMVQMGVEVGQRGNSNNGLIQENFTRFNIGFTFAPHKFDRWFVRSKIE